MCSAAFKLGYVGAAKGAFCAGKQGSDRELFLIEFYSQSRSWFLTEEPVLAFRSGHSKNASPSRSSVSFFWVALVSLVRLLEFRLPPPCDRGAPIVRASPHMRPCQVVKDYSGEVTVGRETGTAEHHQQAVAACVKRQAAWLNRSGATSATWRPRKRRRLSAFRWIQYLDGQLRNSMGVGLSHFAQDAAIASRPPSSGLAPAQHQRRSRERRRRSHKLVAARGALVLGRCARPIPWLLERL